MQLRSGELPQLPVLGFELVALEAGEPAEPHVEDRLGPGRLYEVPVRVGWLDRPHAESELNPVPLNL